MERTAMNSEFTWRERYLLIDDVLDKRLGSLRLGIAVTSIVGVTCSALLLANHFGLNLPDFVRELLWVVAVSSFTGMIAAWREKRWVPLVKKLKDRILELEANASNGAGMA
jgi:hypothetical protein